MKDNVMVKVSITNPRGVEFLVTWEIPADGKKIEKALRKVERLFGEPTCPWPLLSDKELVKSAKKRAAKKAKKAEPMTQAERFEEARTEAGRYRMVKDLLPGDVIDIGGSVGAAPVAAVVGRIITVDATDSLTQEMELFVRGSTDEHSLGCSLTEQFLVLENAPTTLKPASEVRPGDIVDLDTGLPSVRWARVRWAGLEQCEDGDDRYQMVTLSTQHPVTGALYEPFECPTRRPLRLISTTTPIPSEDVVDLLDTFGEANPAARAWAKYVAGDELPDCDTMSLDFSRFAAERGYSARTVHCEPRTSEPWYGDHWFTVLDGWLAVDWTARQFYNVANEPNDWLNPDDIATPTLFRWPGTYPVPGVDLVESKER